jgi:hypothetical protein
MCAKIGLVLVSSMMPANSRRFSIRLARVLAKPVLRVLQREVAAGLILKHASSESIGGSW